ncbi:MAG: FtsQ-type POTRA domain-containing protein [Gudongella sp.]|nr:FtsQ-type POTRA domain-containing protein [Gudongella sp.]
MVKETRVQRKQRKRRLIFKIVLFIVVIAGLAVWALNTSFFAIKTINVEGINILNEADIVLESEIQVGQNIIKTSKKKIEEKIEMNPYVKTAKIIKKLPGEIKIEILERKPYMQIEYNYSFGVLDNEGIVLEYSKEKLDGITVLEGFEWKYIKAGESLLIDDNEVIPPDFFNDDELNSIVSKMNKIVYDIEDNIKIDLYNGIMVEFGPSIDIKYKLRMLEEILADIEAKNILASKIIMNKGEYPIVVRDEK